MDKRCRFCGSAGSDRLIPISSMVVAYKKTVAEIIRIVQGIRHQLPRNDDEPDHLCGQCLCHLECTYRMWKRCRASSLLKRCEPGQELHYLRCRFCHEEKRLYELTPLDSVCQQGTGLDLPELIEAFAGVKIAPNDRLPPYSCGDCLEGLERSFDFRTRAFTVDEYFGGQVVHPWECMKFQRLRPDQLVVELSAAGLLDGDSVCCSVCRQITLLDAVQGECPGCLLRFRNAKKLRRAAEIYGEMLEELGEATEAAAELNEGENCLDAEELPICESNSDANDSHPEAMDVAESEMDSCQNGFAEEVEQVPAGSSEQELDLELEVEDACQLGDESETSLENEFKDVFNKSNEQELDVQSETTFEVEMVSAPNLADTGEAKENNSVPKYLTPHDWCKEIIANKKPVPKVKRLRPRKTPYKLDPTKTEEIVLYECCVEDCTWRDSLELLDRHCETEHSAAEVLLDEEKHPFCRYCSTFFQDEKDKREHRKLHSVTYRCLVDNCYFATKFKLLALMHGSQEPHRFPKKHKKGGYMPDHYLREYFHVSGAYNERTDIMTRTGEYCCGCYEMFGSAEQLRAHSDQMHPVKENTEQAQFRCELCKRSFGCYLLLDRHQQSADNRRHYYCRICRFFMWGDNQLWMHLASSHPEAAPDEENLYEAVPLGGLPCCGCDELFPHEQALQEHRRAVHANDAELPSKEHRKCDLCNQVMHRRRLPTHLAVYERKFVYHCKTEECGFNTNRLLEIKKHILENRHGRKPATVQNTKVPKREQTSHVCCVNACGFRHASYDAVIQHAKDEHQRVRMVKKPVASKKPYACQVCCKGFNTEDKLLSHMSNLSRYSCKHCGTKVVREIFATHLEQCTADRPAKNDQLERDAPDHRLEQNCAARPEVCNICNGKFKNVWRLRTHLANVHAPKEICDVCGKAFKPTYLPIHLDTHANERIWKCPQCPRAFNRENVLRNHLKVHTGEKPYQCRLGCENRYKQSGDRTRHENLVHRGLTPFTCKICPKSFLRDRELRLHERIHTGLKLYHCNSCSGAGFDKLSELKQHQEECPGGN